MGERGIVFYIYFFSSATCKVISEPQAMEAEMLEGKEARSE